MNRLCISKKLIKLKKQDFLSMCIYVCICNVCRCITGHTINIIVNVVKNIFP